MPDKETSGKKPSSQKRIEASRRNGALAKGRKTPEGIQRSARNAYKHGLTSEYLCNNQEDSAALDAMRQSYYDFYKPVGPLELDLLQDIVVARFRLQRCIALESQAMFLEAALQQPVVEKAWVEPTESARLALAVSALAKRERTLDHYRRYESLHRRTIDRAVKELERVQNQRLSPPPAGPGAAPTPSKQKIQNDPRSGEKPSPVPPENLRDPEPFQPLGTTAATDHVPPSGSVTLVSAKWPTLQRETPPTVVGQRDRLTVTMAQQYPQLGGACPPQR